MGNALADEVANILQHVKDVWDKIGHHLGAQASAEMSKLHDQAAVVLDTVKADVQQDASDIGADVHEDVAEAQASTGQPGTAGVPGSSAPATPTSEPSAPTSGS